MDYYKIPAGLLRYNIDPGEIGSWTLLATYAKVSSEGCCGESEGEDTHTHSSGLPAWFDQCGSQRIAGI